MPESDPTCAPFAWDGHVPEVALAAPYVPRTCSFDLVDGAMVDSFTRVEVRCPHYLMKQVLRALPSLSYDDAHAIATTAWADAFVITGTAEPSSGAPIRRPAKPATSGRGISYTFHETTRGRIYGAGVHH